MQKVFLTCMLLFAANGLVVSQVAPGKTKETDQNQSWEDTVVEKRSLDFGDVKIGTTIKPVVVLKNQTSEPFVIESISSSCGCMKPMMDAKSIEAGSSEELLIKLDTQRFLGRRSASIHIAFAKPKGKEIKLAAKVNIRNLVCEPEQIQFVGIDVGEQSTRELNIRRVGSPFWKIKSIESSSDVLTADIQSFKVGNNEVRYLVSCAVKPDAKQSGVRNEKLILHTNDSSELTYEIPVVIRTTSEIKVSPALLDFSQVKQGGKKIAIVRTKKAMELDFHIEPEGGFEILKITKINDRTLKIEVSRLSSQAKNSRLVIKSVNANVSQEVEIVANEDEPKKADPPE